MLYPLPEIVLLLLCSTLAEADSFVEVQLWGEQNPPFCAGRCPTLEHHLTTPIRNWFPRRGAM